MYQDNRETLVPIPPYDCKPFQNYPENPDWLYFFSEWEKIKDTVGDLPALLPDIEKNTAQRIIYVNERGQYLKHQNQKPLVQTPADKPVEVDREGKLWYKPEPSGVFSVNGQKGNVEITAESIGAMPADTPIPPPYELPTATDTRLGGVRAIPKTDAMTDEVGIDEFGHLFVEPSSGPLPPEYKLPVASVTTLGGVKAEEKTEEYSEPVAVDKQGKLFVKPSTPPEKKEVDVYDYPPMPIPEGIQLFVDESEDPVPIKVPTKVSDLENDSKFEMSQTIKVDVPLAGVSDIETLRTFLYNQRKAVQRKAQFEVSPGGVNVYLMDILGYPAGATADNKAFLYIEIPFSEAGGYQIKYTYQLRDKEGVWERIDHSTLNSNWKSTGWMDKVDCMSKQEAVETFCPPFEVTAPVVTCNPVTRVPYPIHVVSQTTKTDKVELTRCGENLFNIKDVDFKDQNIEVVGNSIVIKPGANDRWAANFIKNLAKNGVTQIYISAKFSATFTGRIYAFLGTSVYASQIHNGVYKNVANITAEGDKNGIVFIDSMITIPPEGLTISDISVTPGPVPSSYTPYTGSTFTAQLPPDTIALDWTNWKYQTSDGKWHDMTGQAPDIKPLPGVNTLYSDTGDTTVSGREDPTATLDSLAKRVTALENHPVPQQMYPATIAPEGVEDTPTIIPEIGVDENGST